MDAGGDRPDARTATLTGIRIEPAAAMLVAADGAMPTVDLEIVAVYDDGSTAPIATGFWDADVPVLGAVDRDTGVYTASGAIAGTATVTVEALSQTATATVTVRVEHTVIATGAPADAADRFAGAPVVDPARAATLLYPLEGTVFPGNVYPADVQWEGGAAGDLYRVRLDASGVAVRAYVAHSGGAFAYDWPVTREAWRALAESAPGTDVTVAVDRWDSAGSAVIEGAPRTVRFADATIRGAIYYWDLGAGRILRIRGDGTGRETFMPSPPRRPGDGRQCVACHAISRDGRRMAAELWDERRLRRHLRSDRRHHDRSAPDDRRPRHGAVPDRVVQRRQRAARGELRERALPRGRRHRRAPARRRRGPARGRGRASHLVARQRGASRTSRTPTGAGRSTSPAGISR